MIKKFNEFINEDFTDLYKRWKNKEVRKEDSLEIKLKQFLSTTHNSQNYYIENRLVCCKGDVVIDDGDLNDGKLPFKFGKVEGDFCCSFCKELKSLEGAPEKVEGNFKCCYCEELKSLEGAPKYVGGNFSCYNCEELKSLEGAPKEVKGDFSCLGCDILSSLEGAPKEVEGDFICGYCGKKFTKSDLPSGTIIKGKFKDRDYD